jgi:hypothetical protein
MTVLMYPSYIYNTPETEIEKPTVLTIMTATIYILDYVIS